MITGEHTLRFRELNLSSHMAKKRGLPQYETAPPNGNVVYYQFLMNV